MIAIEERRNELLKVNGSDNGDNDFSDGSEVEEDEGTGDKEEDEWGYWRRNGWMRMVMKIRMRMMILVKCYDNNNDNDENDNNENDNNDTVIIMNKCER